MPLPSSGTITINQIRNELGTSNGSLRYLSSLAGKSTPDAMSEFYGYSNTVAIALYFNKYPTFTGGSATLYINNTSVGSINTNGSTLGYNATIGSTFRVTVSKGPNYADLSIIRGSTNLYTNYLTCLDFGNINSDTITVTSGGPYDAYAYVEECYEEGPF